MRAWENHETVEEYLAREGKITLCPRSDLAERKPLPEAPGRSKLVLHRDGGKPQGKVRRKYTAEQEAETLRRLQAGEVQREICHVVGVSQWTVSQIAQAHGLGRKPREVVVS